MTMKNRDYWKLRDELDKALENGLLLKISMLVDKGYMDTENEIYAFYGRYATNNKLSYQEANRLLTPEELRECAQRIKRLKRYLNSYDKNPFDESIKQHIEREIRLLQGRTRTTRLQALYDSINEKWIDIAIQVDRETGKLLRETYSREYNESSKKQTSIKLIEAAILIPIFGRHFSDNIWKHKDNTVAFVNAEFNRSLVMNRDVRNTIKIIHRQRPATYHQLERLIRTENCTARTAGTLDGYKDSDVKYVQVVVLDDEMTCPDCSSEADRIIPLNEVSIGVNAPPYHPNCRCSIIPVIK